MYNLVTATQRFIKEFTVKDNRGKVKPCWVSIVGALMVISVVLTFVMTLVGA